MAEMKVLQTMLHQLFANADVKGIAATAGTAQGKVGAAAGDQSAWTPPPRWVPNAGTDVLATIKEAIAVNRMDVYLQPVVRLPQRKTMYYEALTRLRAADGSLIEPGVYLQPAEEQGLIGAIDNALLFRCVQLLRMIERKRPELSIFCNVSGTTVSDTAFFSQFVEFLEQNAQLAGRLILEFPCDGFLAQSQEQAANLARLNELGYRFSVDRALRQMGIHRAGGQRRREGPGNLEVGSIRPLRHLRETWRRLHLREDRR
ncbi:MAG: EAL domain-containing protein [Alphaproteobacteria bacterium]|nr:EAL domain-containing protein [Alphaproteobacteria bacterium]